MDIEKKGPNGAPLPEIVNETSIYDEGIFYRLFDVAELVRWKMSD